MGLNSKGRTDNLRRKLAEKDLDGIFISQPENRFYLSGFNGSAGYLFITDKLAVLVSETGRFVRYKAAGIRG
jgi:Xaa-Pro aminopeptidase